MGTAMEQHENSMGMSLELENVKTKDRNLSYNILIS
jgi:hypothetical protein